MWLFDQIRTVPDVARHWARETPEKVALIEENATRTYSELDRRSSALGARMQEAGVQPGSRIGYLGKNSIAFFEIWFAATKIGCAIAPFNWRSAAEELLVLLDDACPAIVFVAEEFREALERLRLRAQTRFDVVPFGATRDALSDWVGAADAQVRSDGPQRGDVALLTYTSGTTARPKGVKATHEAFQYSFLCSYLEPTLNFSRDDMMLMAMPSFHLGGSWVSLGALYFGGAVSIIPAFDPHLLANALRRDRPSLLPLVPTAMQVLLNRSDFSAADYHSVRSILYFGSPIGRELLNLTRNKLDCDLTQLYGTSEAWILTALDNRQHNEGSDARLGSCGRALPLVGMKTVDPAGNELPNGTVGEVVVRTPAIFAGYFNQPDATRSVLTDGWYHTGDLGWRDDEGYYYLVDRAKDMIISGGENVYSAEVEAALLKHPAIAQVGVIGAPDPKWGEKVVALVVLGSGASVSEADLLEHCRTYLARYKVPKSIHFETSLPTTPTGKVQKGILRQRFRE